MGKLSSRSLTVNFMLPVLLVLLVLFTASCGGAAGSAQASEIPPPFPIAPLRIAHVMSFHSPWKWTDDQFEGFRSTFRNLPVEYRVWQLDEKRQTDTATIENTVQTTRDEVVAWKPDLLYVSDDPALNQVASSFFGTRLPIVFSGVNSKPAGGAFLDFRNITGVFEQELFLESYRLLRAIIPGAERIAVIWDDDTQSWKGVIDNIMEARKQLPGLEFPFFGRVETFQELKDLILKDFPGNVDAICFVGVFGFKDDNGIKVPYEEVMQWIAENSPFPDMSFWEDRIDRGTLCGVIVSALRQGQEAGILARNILVDHKSPDSLEALQGTGGLPMINLKRAKALGLKIPTDLLLNSTVKTGYAGDDRASKADS